MGKKIEKYAVEIFSAKINNLDSLIKQSDIPENVEVLDIIEGSLKELYEIKHPEKKDNFKEEDFNRFLNDNDIDSKTYGNWVFYVWRNLLIRVPPMEDYRLIRTARNQLLITPDEQHKLFSKTIFIAGMSVGSNVVGQIVHGGIAGKLILADMDTLELTNLNRIFTGIYDIGSRKVESVARKALELDPYLSVFIIDKGVTEDSIKELQDSEEHVIDLIVDEVDDIEAKIQLRKFSQRLSAPLLMATDNSDGAILDVERYDLSDEQQMFNGRIPSDILDLMKSGELPREQAGAAIGKYFVGIDLVDNRLLQSLSQVRKTIPSWPQLGTAASLSGILVGYCSKIILLGGELKDNRYVASYDKDFNNEFTSREYENNRGTILKLM